MEIDRKKKLLDALELTRKKHPDLTFEDADRFIEAVETQLLIDKERRVKRSFPTQLLVVAANIQLKESEDTIFNDLIYNYYSAPANVVIHHDFRSHGLRSTSRL